MTEKYKHIGAVGTVQQLLTEHNRNKGHAPAKHMAEGRPVGRARWT
jgi:hypothetical protein